jgi:predicted transcriptional regulator
MTLQLSDREMIVLQELATARGLSKTALLRQALRLYQSITERLRSGEKLFLEHPDTKEKAELVVL